MGQNPLKRRCKNSQKIKNTTVFRYYAQSPAQSVKNTPEKP